MARLIDDPTPVERDSAPDTDNPAKEAQAELMVREAHSALTGTFLGAHQINRYSFQHNPGVARNLKGNKKRLRSECLQDACKTWPYLLRELPVPAGKPPKFQRRNVDVQAMTSVFQNICEEESQILHVFGAWSDWKWSTEQTGEATWDDLAEGPAPNNLH